uniref:WD and tetratricopeptide repeats protein 1 n=1 Tax=Toxocara canis TaxID=6265 RepID=A0A183V2V0_TOXCA
LQGYIMEHRVLKRELRPLPIPFQRNCVVNDHLLERFGHSKTLKASKATSSIRNVTAKTRSTNCNRVFLKCNVSTVLSTVLWLSFQGHDGCVNCLQWNHSGTLLASGSDDMFVRIWNAEGAAVHSFSSGHMNNIFSVQFLPSGNDEIIISAAGDTSVRMHTYTHDDSPFVWWSGGRVKRLAVTRADPLLFWSAAEDGIIKQYDARTSGAMTLIKFAGKECKSLAVNETRPEMMSVALNEAAVPIYDRRNVSKPMLTVVPGHIPITEEGSRHTFRSLSVTHVGFNSLGNELIVNIGGEQIYIFNVLDRVNEPDALQSLNGLLEAPARLPVEDVSTLSIEQRTTDRFRIARERAKINFNNKEYTDAIDTYSRAILECEALCGTDPSPTHVHAMDLCLLLSNRGASYLRRQWEGDAYACLLDMIRALKIEPRNTKAHYRIVKALMELRQFDMARKVSHLFKERFPCDRSCEKLERMLRGDPDTQIEWTSSNCGDYVQRLCGHCNTNTDIKEAVWFGGRDEYIAAGSDCGSLLMWERKSGALVKAFEADKNILNCVQPHPTTCLLATSGIEHVIRFWQPLPEEGVENRRERHGLSALSAENQKRMHTGIFEMVVASIGLAVQNEIGLAVHNDDDDDQEGVYGRRIGCNTT